MKILITGATGYVGRAVAAAALEQGHEVVAAVRDAAARDRLPARVGSAVAPLEDPAALSRSAAEADGVIHLAFDHALQRDASAPPKVGLERAMAKERAALEALAAGLEGRGRPLVAASACGILGDTGTTAVDEEHPSPPDFMPALRRVAEEDLRRFVDRGVRSAAVRIPLMTHTQGGGGVLSRMKATAAERGFSGYIGAGDNRLSSVNLADLADLFLLALDSASPGSIYNGAGGDVSTREMAQALGIGAGGVELRSVSLEEAREIWGPFAAGLLSINNRCSCEKARTELGWRPYATTNSLMADLASA